MNVKKYFINKIVLYVSLFWSVFLLTVGSFLVFSEYMDAKNIAKEEAVVSVQKDLAYRSWAASHGGVYVPITKRTPPNPYLSHIKNRDVNTTANQQLTLMNPAYILTQMMKDYANLYGTKGHITSKILLNPKNKPDSWERQALDTIEITRKPVMSMTKINNKDYLRYLNPLVIKQPCLKCHAFQGYKLGDIRGGVSVSIPMDRHYKLAYDNSVLISLTLLLIWLIGLGAIYYGRKFVLKELDKKIKDYEQHIYSLVSMIEKRDSYTAGHTQRVANYSVLIAKEMGYVDEDIDNLYRACMLHDIGKVSTPDSILLKPGKLSKLEFNIIKEHVSTSYEILKGVDIYKDIAEIVRHHHETYDGHGYPNGLKGDEIPMLSQIMTLADSFDAMTTNRIYKARKTVQTAIAELKALSSKQFNPIIVDAAVIALKDVKIDTSISQQPQSKLEKERFVYFYNDSITGVYNREYLDYILSYNHDREFNFSCVYVVYIHNFTKYNKQHGWSNGDIMLRKFAKGLENISNEDMVFRLYGDDFIILSQKHFDIKNHLFRLEDIIKGSCLSFSYSHFDIKRDTINSIEDLEKLIST
jgi:putative nucleotidyltransferase with HDIG domain